MVDVRVRLWDRDKDYSFLEHWWKIFTIEPVPVSILPTDGFIAEKNGAPLAAGFVYFTNNAPIAYADWYIVNPNAPMMDRYRGLNAIYERIDQEATQRQCQIITSICSSKPLIKMMTQKHGYEIAEQRTMHLIKRLPNSQDIDTFDAFRDQEAIDQHSEQDKWKKSNTDDLTDEQKKYAERLEKDMI